MIFCFSGCHRDLILPFTARGSSSISDTMMLLIVTATPACFGSVDGLPLQEMLYLASSSLFTPNGFLICYKALLCSSLQASVLSSWCGHSFQLVLSSGIGISVILPLLSQGFLLGFAYLAFVLKGDSCKAAGHKVGYLAVPCFIKYTFKRFLYCPIQGKKTLFAPYICLQ